jgi:hypothetical protein
LLGWIDPHYAFAGTVKQWILRHGNNKIRSEQNLPTADRDGVDKDWHRIEPEELSEI